MEHTATAVMQTRFSTLSPENTIHEAVNMMQEASRKQSRRVFGMMVTDAAGNLAGMFSMFDVFLFLRPKHVQIWGEMPDINLDGLIDDALSRAGKILVGDLMTTELISISPDTDLMVIVDIMIKKHVRRLPVIADGQIVGIVYLSDLFDYLVAKFAK